jgi:hypothetical protein
MDEQITPAPKSNQTAVLWVILAVVIVIILGALYYYMQKTEPSINSNVVVNTNRATSTNTAANTNIVANTNTPVNTNSTTIDTSDWHTYTNDTLSFTLRYPSTWVVVQDSVSDGIPYIQFADERYINSDTERLAIVVSKYTLTSNQSLKQWAEGRIASTGYETSLQTADTQSGLEGYRYSRSLIEDEYVFQRGDAIFVIDVGHFQRQDIKAIGGAFADSFEII